LIPWRDVLEQVAKIVAPGVHAGPRARGNRQGQHRVACDAPLLEWFAPVRSHRDAEMKVAELLAAVAAAVALLAGAPAGAQAKYPSKNIEVVVPFARRRHRQHDADDHRDHRREQPPLGDGRARRWVCGAK
jgi:hypothetical protein